MASFPNNLHDSNYTKVSKCINKSWIFCKKRIYFQSSPFWFLKIGPAVISHHIYIQMGNCSTSYCWCCIIYSLLTCQVPRCVQQTVPGVLGNADIIKYLILYYVLKLVFHPLDNLLLINTCKKESNICTATNKSRHISDWCHRLTELYK